MKFGLKKRDLTHIIETLSQYPEINEAILFGSRAIGNFKKGSDIDIAIKGENISHRIIADLTNSLEETLPIPFFFDIIHFNTIGSNQLLEHINRVGIKIYPSHE